MALLTTAARNAACDAVVDLVDVGAAANGTLEILDGASVLATFAYDATAFGAAATGAATAASFPKTVTASGTGTADGYQVKDADGTVVWSGAIGEITIDNTNIASGQDCTVNSHIHSQAAGS